MSSDSKPSSLRALLGPRVQIRAANRVTSGSPAVLHLSNPIHELDAPGAALVMAERGLSLRSAHAIVTRLFDEGNAVVEQPIVESLEAVKAALAECGVEATPCGTPDRIDVRAIRDALDLSQEDFALSFGLGAQLGAGALAAGYGDARVPPDDPHPSRHGPRDSAGSRPAAAESYTSTRMKSRFGAFR